MASYLVIFSFLFLSFGFMVLMLKFSKHKEREAGCCSDGIEDEQNHSSCFTCPTKDEESCIPNQINKLSESSG